MHFIMYWLGLVFIYNVAIACRFVAQTKSDKQKQDILKVERYYQTLREKRDHMLNERRIVEQDAFKLYTLYDMTKKITKNFNEQEAIHIFKSKLKESISYDECFILDPYSEEIKKVKDSKEYFIYSLKGKEKILGYLVMKGLFPQDKEKLMILAHQFSLTLVRMKLYHELERMAITDSLTEVYTRRYLMDRFKEEITRSKSHGSCLSFLMIDVDFFKNYNDQYGHLTGDQILREIARIIRESIREIDIAGRFGGEEFSVILPDTNRSGALYVAERVRSSVEQSLIKAYDTTVRSTVSIGIATFPLDAKDIHDLIDKADWALYKAKKFGRNKILHFKNEHKK